MLSKYMTIPVFPLTSKKKKKMANYFPKTLVIGYNEENNNYLKTRIKYILNNCYF